MNTRPVVIISGGSRGLGEAITQHLLNEDYCVATFSRSKTSFIEQMLQKDPEQQRFYWESIDAQNFSQLKSFVLKVQKHFGRMDGLINNAGLNMDELLPLSGDEAIQRILAVNLEAVIHLCRAVSRLMLIQSNGTIINISSVLGLRGFKGTSVYAATKAALDGLTRSLARELGSKGIRVNSIAPGFIETDMTAGMDKEKRAQTLRRTPLGRLGKVEDISNAVTFLLSKQAGFITGHTLVIDGGLAC